MVRKKVISIALAALLTTGTVFGDHPALYQSMLSKAKTTTETKVEKDTKVTVDEKQVDANEYGLADNIQDGTILHCFDWKYTDIQAELKNIAEAGFSAVQTSPAQKGDGQVWYWLYQPQTFSIQTNALGTKAELQALCAEAKKYGIKVIVDVVANHTRAIGDDGLGSDCYHTDEGGIDYGPGSNRYDYTHKRIGMPDLNSESATVQNKVKGYIQELKDAGVEGIRWDAAKHIGLPSEDCQFWPAVTSLGLYNYGEILNGPLNGYGNNDELMKEYTKYISVTDDEYGEGILHNFEKGNVSSAIGNYAQRGVNRNKLVYWAESHDTYANDGEYGKQTAYTSENVIDRTYAVVAAQADATSLYFSRPSEKKKQSILAGVKGSTHFTSKEVAAVNHVHNACIGEKDYLVSENGAVAVCRNSGAVIVKGSGSGQVTIKNGDSMTEPGTYVDEVSGNTFTVTKETISGTVGDTGIAAFYNAGNVVKNPKVTASKASGTFTEPFELTLTPANADKATYSINGGDAVEFTKATKVKIGEGCSIGDKVTVKVTATGEGDPFEETFTYTMAETPAYKCYLRVKKSDFTDGAPNLYLYSTDEVALNGAWPGEAMKEEGDYYVFTSDTVEGGLAILSKGDWRSVPAMGTGATVSGCMEYDKTSNKFTTFTLETKAPTTKAPTKEPEKTKTPATKEPTPTPSKGTKTPEPSKDTKTPEPSNDTDSMISVSLKDESAFTTETEKVKITLNGATEGSYSVDGGPEKSFKTSTTAVLGQGKIADTDVTLTVTAKSGKNEETETFTYHKVFDGDKADVKTSALHKMQNLFEVVADAAQADAAAESGGMYATNPSGVGKEATITIDGSFSDWSEDMLIAQCGAWDIANAWKGGHENCVLDCYSLYGACDDKNLYIGWQMVNTTDTWARSGDGPLSDGGRVLDVPLIVALNVGTAQKMTGGTLDGKGIWGADVTFDTRVDHLLYMSGKPGLGSPGIFKAAGADGLVDYENKESCSLFKEKGIEYDMAEGCLPKTIMGLEGSQSVDDAYDASAYKDMMAKGHDTQYDSFYEISIPLSELGVTKADVEANGIGAMVVATRGLSAIDCIPHDPSMLDNVTGDCAVDPSTSHEKDDADIITVPLAAIGNAKAGGEGGGTVTTQPTKTTEPEKTSDVKKTASPEPTKEVKETEVPATKEPTKEPEKTKTPATEEPKPTSNPGSKFTVNFGADRSSPQLSTTELTLKAVAYGGEKGYKYEFMVDGETVQKASTKSSYNWAPKKGEHTIKVVVEDADGTKISSEKEYVIEEEENAVVTPKVTPTTPAKTATPTEPTKTATPTSTPKEDSPTEFLGRMKFSVASPQKLGKTIGLELVAQGGTTPYQYSVVITDKNGKVVRLLNNSSESKVTWKPSKTGTYKVYGRIVDANGKAVVKNTTYTITANKVAPKITVKTFKASKYTVAKGKSVKIVMKATSSNKGKIQYKLSVQKKGTKKKSVIRSYSTKTAYTWKAKKKGKYTIYMTVKDAKGKTTTKKLKKQIVVK